MSDRQDLAIALRSQFPILIVSTFEEVRMINLLKQLAGKIDIPMSQWTVTDGLTPLHGDATFNADTLRLVGETPAENEARSTAEPDYALRMVRKARQQSLILLLDFHPFLNDPVNIRLIKEIAQNYDLNRQKLIFISHDLQLPPELSRMAVSFTLRLPGPQQIGRIVTEESAIWSTRNPGENIRVDREAVNALMRNLTGLTDTDARRLVRNAITDGAITVNDVPEIVAAKRELVGQDGLLSFEHDTANLSDIGGFNHLKQWLSDRAAQFSNVSTELADRPKGVMLLGVQGGGKSLAAKAIAGIWSLPLLRLDFGMLYNKFFGETERNLREALAMAEVMAPCVLWCDEIEKGISTGDYDSGTSKRLLGTLLTWMSEHDKRVFIVATANDVSALPPELMRKGRLDEIFFIDLPGGEVRQEILRIHLSKRGLDPEDFELGLLAELSNGFTGAEIEQSIVAAHYTAQAREMTVSTDVVAAELVKTKPLSVVRGEDIASLRRWANGRTVSAG